MSFSTPILFLIFNRIDTITQVFNEIRKIKPKKFYIACDGTRKHKEGEQQKVEELRNFVLNSIDGRARRGREPQGRHGLHRMDSDIKWKVQYEDSLIQPIREVIDINTGEYASGNR